MQAVDNKICRFKSRSSGKRSTTIEIKCFIIRIAGAFYLLEVRCLFENIYSGGLWFFSSRSVVQYNCQYGKNSSG